MGQNSELACEVQAQIIALHDERLLCQVRASQLKCHHTIVVRTIKKAC